MSDYPYIRAWARLIGWDADADVEAARRDNAPEDAIYQRKNGEWVTFSYISSDEVRDKVQAFVDHIYGEKDNDE